MKRRTFIQSSALALAGAGLTNTLFAKGGSPYKNKVGLQLYSLRDVIFKDPKAVLKTVAESGYKELETYGYDNGKLFSSKEQNYEGMPIKDFNDHTKVLGLKCISGHYGIDQVKENWEKTCEQARFLGQEYVVVPSLPEEYHKSLDGIKRACEILNKGAVQAKTFGLRMGFHNHADEFKVVDGQIKYDVMLKELDPKLVSMELDLYWIVRAGYDPIKYFEKYPGRFEQWHVKDMDKVDNQKNADIGTGSINFKKIFASAKLAGMKHFYIEQETYPISPIQSVKSSIKNLLTIV